MGVVVEGTVVSFEEVRPEKGKPFQRVDVLVNGGDRTELLGLKAYQERYTGPLNVQVRARVRVDAWQGKRGVGVTWYAQGFEVMAAKSGDKGAARGASL